LDHARVTAGRLDLGQAPAVPDPRARDARTDPVSPRHLAVEALADAARADVLRRVPAGQRTDLDDVAGMRSVDEGAAADIDADMPEPVEEDEVTGLQRILRHRRPHPVLGGRVVGQ